jgi:hypothetical protein
MRSNDQQDPEPAQLGMGPLPFPALRFSAGSEPLSRLPYGAPKNGAVWTRPRSPLKEKTLHGRGNGSSVCHSENLPAPPAGRRWSSLKVRAPNFTLDTDRPSHRRRRV